MIPNHLHFIWFGDQFPEFAQFAVLSALKTNPGARVSIWYEGRLAPHDYSRLGQDRDLRFEAIDAKTLFLDLPGLSPESCQELLGIYESLSKPAARANMVRLAVLNRFGGVYLDTDTLSLRSLDEERRYGAFCGRERVLFPRERSRFDPRLILRWGLRRAFASVPYGYLAHRILDPSYALAENNAVLGARAEHALLIKLLTLATQVPPNERLRRFRLGTHLLQGGVAEYLAEQSAGLHQLTEDSLHVYGPTRFYPVGPEMSLHYFRYYSDPGRVSAQLLDEETTVIHWYASVADLLALGSESVRAAGASSVYSHLCRPYADQLSA